MTSPRSGLPWKWILIGGGALLLLAVGGVVGIGALVLGSLKSCGAYTQALAAAQAHPAVVQALGAPVEADWYVMGSVNLVNDGGHAELSIPLKGGSGRTGKLIVTADKAGGAWALSQLDLMTMTAPETYNTRSLLP